MEGRREEMKDGRRGKDEAREGVGEEDRNKGQDEEERERRIWTV